eukprot:COSAG06_NODE_3412_length_5381_cov_5.527262_1_plen_222_part_00
MKRARDRGVLLTEEDLRLREDSTPLAAPAIRAISCMKQLGLSGGISLGTAGSSTACGQQHGLETMAAADSGLVRVAALYNIKKEPGQEPTAANSHDEQHAAAAKDSGADQAVADLAALAAPVGPIAAAAAALQQGSAVAKHQRPVPGNDQAVHHEVKSSGEEDCEPVAKRQKECVTASEFVGVSWATSMTSTRRRDPSTRRRGGCEATMRTADNQERTGIA